MNPGDPIQLKHVFVPCDLCGADDASVRYRIDPQHTIHDRLWLEGKSYRLEKIETVVSCKQCGLTYVNPRLATLPGLSSYTFEEEIAYFERTRPQRQIAYANLIDSLPKWLGYAPGSLLDIGCGDGLLLEIARQAGMDAIGTERSQRLAQLVQKHLGEDSVYPADLSRLSGKRFDVVTLINVIEHLESPRAMLTDIYSLLKTGGLLVIHTINFGGLPARLLKSRWSQIEPYEHFFYFTAQTLAKMLRRTGFSPIGRFSLVISTGFRRSLQLLLEGLGVYLDNGLGVIARRVDRS